jgi:hypothetical protein
MTGKLFAHLRQQWIGVLALLLVLTGGTAYALDGSNTVFSDDLVNGEVKVADVGQGAVATEEIANSQVKAADIGDGEVQTADLANGQVKTADIGDGEVRSGDVANDNLTGGDIAANSLKGADIDEATLGGFAGSEVIVRNGPTVSIDPGEAPFLTSECETGERATGGGIKFLIPLATDRVVHVAPTNGSGTVSADMSTPRGWGGRIFNGSNAARDARATAICTDAP